MNKNLTAVGLASIAIFALGACSSSSKDPATTKPAAVTPTTVKAAPTTVKAAPTTVKAAPTTTKTAPTTTKKP
jgi:hypothetical protein